jgi:hypothetical protein
MKSTHKSTKLKTKKRTIKSYLSSSRYSLTNKIYKIDKIDKIDKKNFNNLEYPYYKNFISLARVLKDFEKLKRYNPIYLKRNPLNKRLNNFQNRLIIFKEDYDLNKNLYNITDYFSQSCRVKCINNLKTDLSPLEYFQKNKDTIFNNNKYTNNKYTNNKYEEYVNYEDIKEYLYKKAPQCTNFNTTVVISILKFLKPKRYLDPSAGWGDRLIGAIAYGCSYTGIDPSNCMYPIYNNIIKTLTPYSKSNNTNEYNIIKGGFEDENTIIKSNYYDLVFTSPPFFDFEIYENDKKQSVEKFNTLEKWLNGFLYPMILKSYKALVIKGYFGLYISDYTGVSFTARMFEYIQKNIKGFKYQGDIHFWDHHNKKNARTIFFFQKNF